MKKNTNLKLQSSIQREQEIEQYGRQLSLRPSVAHSSKKNYSRKEKHREVHN